MDTQKGQYFSFDALMSTLILVIAVSLLGAYWFGVQNNSLQQQERLALRALAISDVLLTSGQPQDWSDASIAASHGLAFEKNISLSPQKVSLLSSYLSDPANYALECSKFSVPNFFVRIAPLGGSPPSLLGIEPPQNALKATATRVAPLQGGMASVQVIVWENSTSQGA